MNMFRKPLAFVAVGSAILSTVVLPAQSPARHPTPVWQAATLRPDAARRPERLTLEEAAREDRWVGLGVRDVRWAPGGEEIFFRWNLRPATTDDPDGDPWFASDSMGKTVREVPSAEVHLIPGDDITWTPDGTRAAWSRGGAVYLHERDLPTKAGRAVYASTRDVRRIRFARGGRELHFLAADDLFAYSIADGSVRQLTTRYQRKKAATPIADALKAQQQELFEQQRRARERREAASARERHLDGVRPQPLPLDEDQRIDDVQISPDGELVTIGWHREPKDRRQTQYVDYASASGYADVREARPKVGEPEDDYGLALVRWDPTVDPETVRMVPAVFAPAGDRKIVVHGPFWSPEGDRAAVQVLSVDHKDAWIGLLERDGRVDPLAHDHDDAWIGGPPIQPNYLGTGLVEWLAGGRIAFASERTGWSHVHLVDAAGSERALTSGRWEVRDAHLSADRTRWILSASRQHPSDDHLFMMAAGGGPLSPLVTKPGRHTGVLSPDGTRVAIVSSETNALPDLFVADARPGAPLTRVTVSGSDNFLRHAWATPEIVSFPHPDGAPVWAALYEPANRRRNRPAILHIHGGGYRQFSHRGYSVYGHALHTGLLNYLVQQGYTVLDFDYRGSAGFGRAYRTDIYRSMGVKDVDGAVAAAKYLARERGVDPRRIGIYGVSYGGFMTLMSLFRYPGVFAAGIANAAVTDWAHYEEDWTSRILNDPIEDPHSYTISSPIYHGKGLNDPLLIVHGLLDDNVHFQDAARMVQKLIELGKTFEVMYYPVEKHTIGTEASRVDYYRRLTTFFRSHLGA